MLLVGLPPQGSAWCGMKITVGTSVLAFLTSLLFSTSVLSCVDAVLLSDTRLLVHSEQPAFAFVAVILFTCYVKIGGGDRLM